jgi:hypothetical protein
VARGLVNEKLRARDRSPSIRATLHLERQLVSSGCTVLMTRHDRSTIARLRWLALVAGAAAACTGAIGEGGSDRPAGKTPANPGTNPGRGGSDPGSGGPGGPGGAGGTGITPGAGGASTLPGTKPCASTSFTPTRIWRLSDEQYAAAVSDLLPGITVPEISTPGRGKDEFVDDAEMLPVSTALTADLRSSVKTVAEKAIVDLPKLLACTAGQADLACADAFVARFGARAFRRPLDAATSRR